MTAIAYTLGCCGAAIATVTVAGETVAISNADGTEPHRMIGWFSVDDGQLDGPARQLFGDDVQSSVEAAALPNHVSEYVWEADAGVDSHRSWVIRCECGKRVRVTESKLPKLARLLATGDWSKFDGVVLLSVLNARF
jgi:hypothetical protein